jgi:hypothetical protein
MSKFAASVAGIFRGLWLLWVVATGTTFLLARKLLERPGNGPFLTNTLALVFLIPCVHIFSQGMEAVAFWLVRKRLAPEERAVLAAAAAFHICRWAFPLS